VVAALSLMIKICRRVAEIALSLILICWLKLNRDFAFIARSILEEVYNEHYPVCPNVTGLKLNRIPQVGGRFLILFYRKMIYKLYEE
jgi:hypothetical protein